MAVRVSHGGVAWRRGLRCDVPSHGGRRRDSLVCVARALTGSMLAGRTAAAGLMQLLRPMHPMRLLRLLQARPLRIPCVAASAASREGLPGPARTMMAARPGL
jgi:hypothetical protein